MSRNTKSRAGELTDEELLAEAWRELRGAPSVPTYGRSSTTRTAAFSAQYRGLCDRCGRSIERGQEVRYHKDFSRVVHSGCRAPDLTVSAVQRPAVVMGTRMPRVCPDCHLQHAGPCW